MNFLADECCDAVIVDCLRNDGLDLVYVKEFAQGSDDQGVLRRAADEQRILITEDKDFGELVVRLRLPAFGIILLRLNPADSNLKLARLRDLLHHHAERVPGHFVVLDEKKARFRALPGTRS